MSTDPDGASPRRQLGWVRHVPAMLAVLYIVLFLFLSLRRLRYPFALDWMEGPMLDDVRWLLAGHRLYVRPSIDFISFGYNPLYFWVSAALAGPLGASFSTLRLVSLVSSLGTLALLYALVLGETRSKSAGLVGAGLYAATYVQSDQFMDVARVDALEVFLMVAAVWVLRTQTARIGLTVAAGLLVACFLAKQSGLFVAATLALFVYRDKAGSRSARGVSFSVAVVVGVIGSVYLLDATSGGWYRFAAFRVMAAKPLEWTPLVGFWTKHLATPLGCALLLAAFALAGPSGMARRDRGLWAAALVGASLGSWSALIHGSAANAMMPVYALLAPLFAVGLHAALALAREAAPRLHLEVFPPLAAALQLAGLAYRPWQILPTARDEAAGWREVATLSGARGDTFVPADSYLSVMAGKRPHPHEVQLQDILEGPDPALARELSDQIRNAFAEHRWAMVIANDELYPDLHAAYDCRPTTIEPGLFYPAGHPVRPESICTPR